MCVVQGNQRVLLALDVRGMTEVFFHSEYELGHRPARADPERQLDLGPDLKTWVAGGAVRLAFRCDNLVTRDQGVVALEIWVQEDGRISAVKSPAAQQARLDIALRVAKKSAEWSLPCLNKVTFPDRATAPLL